MMKMITWIYKKQELIKIPVFYIYFFIDIFFLPFLLFPLSLSTTNFPFPLIIKMSPILTILDPFVSTFELIKTFSDFISSSVLDLDILAISEI
ncbi:hypothetical protein D3C87_1773840 [compost metagenome]